MTRSEVWAAAGGVQAPCEMTAAQLHDHLFAIWSAARAEANLAYEAWCDAPGAAAYAVYRAAEDRADAAEQELVSTALTLVPA